MNSKNLSNSIPDFSDALPWRPGTDGDEDIDGIVSYGNEPPEL
jgi:hypothetical protein